MTNELHQLLMQLTDDERIDLAHAILDDMRKCPICDQHVHQLVCVPERYLAFVGRDESIMSGMFLLPNERLQRAKSSGVCVACIVRAAKFKRVIRARVYDEKCGKLKISLGYERKRTESGFVYVAQIDDVFKIGATRRSVINRLKAQAIRQEQVVLVLETCYPMDLEAYLHKAFHNERVSKGRSVEMFDLNKEQLSWIASIHEVNGTQVVVYDDPGVLPAYA